MSNYKDKARYLISVNGVEQAATYSEGKDCFISDIDGEMWVVSINGVKVIRELTGVEAAKVGTVLIDGRFRKHEILVTTNNHTAFMNERGTWWTFKEAENWTIKGQEKLSFGEWVEHRVPTATANRHSLNGYYDQYQEYLEEASDE